MSASASDCADDTLDMGVVLTEVDRLIRSTDLAHLTMSKVMRMLISQFGKSVKSHKKCINHYITTVISHMHEPKHVAASGNSKSSSKKRSRKNEEKTIKITKKLATFLGLDSEIVNLSKDQIVKCVVDYIREHKLRDDADPEVVHW